MPIETIPSAVLRQGRERPGHAAYAVRRDGAWRTTSWREYAAEVRRAGRALIALGLPAGGCVCILGFNRPEWVVFDVAAMAAGAAPAGIYTTCSPSEVAYIVHHSESPIVLVENEAQWLKVREKRGELPHLRHVVTMEGAAKIDDPMVLTWAEFLARGDAVPEADLDARLQALEPGGLATLIYTSGTTGPPKGVMLSHQNLSWTANYATRVNRLGPDDSNLSYLPLSHIAEQMFTVHASAMSGHTVYYARSVELMPEDLKEVQPTLFFGVPRVWEKLQAGIAAKLKEAQGAKAALVKWAGGVAREVNLLACEGKQPGVALGLQYRIAGKLLFSKLKPAIGLGRARVCVSGAAPIAREVLEFFLQLDLVVLEVYGQSEDTGPTSFNMPGRTRFGSVGPVIDGIEVRIAGDGEIQVRGPHVFLGYYKEPEATAETLQQGWLCSGDLGELRDGFLYITGRKKEILITAGGKNVAPKNIEAAIKNCALVSEAVVIGDRRKYLTVLVTLDDAAAGKLAGGAAPHEHAEVRAEVQRAIDAANTELARVEQIKRFTILPRQFGIDTGELTPTLKIKRKKVSEIWAREIEAMYADAE